jgi:hypothetical protein
MGSCSSNRFRAARRSSCVSCCRRPYAPRVRRRRSAMKPGAFTRGDPCSSARRESSGGATTRSRSPNSGWRSAPGSGSWAAATRCASYRTGRRASSSRPAISVPGVPRGCGGRSRRRYATRSIATSSPRCVGTWSRASGWRRRIGRCARCRPRVKVTRTPSDWRRCEGLVLLGSGRRVRRHEETRGSCLAPAQRRFARQPTTMAAVPTSPVAPITRKAVGTPQCWEMNPTSKAPSGTEPPKTRL